MAGVLHVLVVKLQGVYVYVESSPETFVPRVY